MSEEVLSVIVETEARSGIFISSYIPTHTNLFPRVYPTAFLVFFKPRHRGTDIRRGLLAMELELNISSE